LSDSSTAEVVTIAAFFAFASMFWSAKGVDVSPILGAAALTFGGMWVLPRVEKATDWLAENAGDSQPAEGEA
jgi:hypothetical protein